MKNKEIEELLNKIKNAIKKHKEEDLQDDMLVILELDVIQWNLLLLYIEQLEKELKEEQEENYKQSEWLVKKQKKIEQLENNRDKAFEYLENHFIFNDKTGECYQTHTFDKDNVKKLYDVLKGDSE